ncbi:MAG TPA: 50S ribosomal protein L25/general stress protein Ctc [Chitinophagales bacterium]|nr:50S ribosomal protein L25/general stress protein Ctc [Chitinophagales bacterium]
MKAITIEGTPRNDVGKKNTQSLRKQGQIPCSIYGGTENINFYAPINSFKELVYTPEFYTAQISVEGKQFNCVMQDIQFHPISDEVLHIDFREMHPEKKIVLELPVKLEGIAPGVKEGGRIYQRMKKMKVRLLPKDLIEHITVKIDHLGLGKSVRVDEVKMEGIEFLNAPHIPVVSVLIPRIEKEEVPAVAAVAVEGAVPAEGAAPVAGAVPPAGEKGAAPAEEKKEKKEKKK